MKAQLVCGVWREGSVFAVSVDIGAKVAELREIIFYTRNFHACYSFPSTALRLLIGRRRDGGWMRIGSDELIAPQLDASYLQLDPSLALLDYLGEHCGHDAVDAIHIVVQLPATEDELVVAPRSILWMVRGSVADYYAKRQHDEDQTPVHAVAAHHKGFYLPEDGKPWGRKATWREGANNALNFGVLFENAEDAFQFEATMQHETRVAASPLFGLTVATNRMEVHGETRDLPDHIIDEDVNPMEGELAIVQPSTALFKYQRIEKYSIFSRYGYAVSVPLVPRIVCESTEAFRGFEDDENNRLAIRFGCELWISGDPRGSPPNPPLVALSVVSVSTDPEKDGRYKVTLAIRGLSGLWASLMRERLPEDTVVSRDGLTMKVAVYVEKPEIFVACVEWRRQKTLDEWKQRYGARWIPTSLF